MVSTIKLLPKGVRASGVTKRGMYHSSSLDRFLFFCSQCFSLVTLIECTTKKILIMTLDVTSLLKPQNKLHFHFIHTSNN